MIWELRYEDEGYFYTVTYEGTSEELSEHITSLCEMGCHNIDYLLISGE